MLHQDLEPLFQRAREISESIVAKNAELVDKECIWPKESLDALLQSGLGRLVVPTAFGGHGLGLYALARICEILGRECPSTAICFGMHCVGTSVIAANATEYQIESFLKPIVKGKHLTTLSLSEPSNGAHFYLPQTEINHTQSGSYIANGTKTFVTNGGHADSYVISGVDSHSDLEDMSCFILPNNSPGMRWGEEWKGLGMRGNSSRTLTLDNVEIDGQHLLGNEGDQIWYMFHVVAPWFLTAMAGTYLGVANRVFDIGREHLKNRSYAHNNKSLASTPLIQHKIATLWADLQKTQYLTFSSAQRFDAGDESALPLVLSSKAEVASTVTTLINEVMTLMGGISYREEGTLHRLLRDARAAHIMSPTTDLLKLWVGRILLDQPILSDE